MRVASRLAQTIIGSESEFEAAGMTVEEALGAGVEQVYLKRGPEGAAIVTAASRLDVAGARVPVVNANAAGAIVASRLACSAAMPDPDEVLAQADATA
jgi:sugar/nucleoside kinase (ribokinase family)